MDCENLKMRVSNRCYAATGLGYSTPWCVNAGFIVGDNLTLVVDTGANALAAQTVYGYASAAKRGNQLLVINTEKHFDHIGGNCFFREQGVDIWGHVGIMRTAEEFQAEIAEFNDSILNDARRSYGEASVFFDGTRLVNPNRQIHGETQFDLGGCAVEILLTPGHTATNLCVWLPEDRVLFAGDSLISKYLPNLDAGKPTDWRRWLESLTRIESLRANLVIAGHGPVVRQDEVQRSLDKVRQVLEDSIARGYSPTASRNRELKVRHKPEDPR